MRWTVLLCCLVLPAAAPPAVCGPAISAAERAGNTAPGLLAAIGLVESGRTDPRTKVRAPWPWTVTAEGIGTFYTSKSAAIEAVQALQGRGIGSIDVGCMQVNLLHHPKAFATLADAFDPALNAKYAARFLGDLFARTGTWPAAAAAYHSFTPDLGAKYGKLIAAVWAGEPVPTQPGPNGVQVVTFPGGGQMRVLRDATAGSGRIAGYLSGP